MERLPHFTKHYMTEADLGALLESRGLVISDEAKAVRYLESIGYYRLSAYMYPFLKVPKESHQYKEGTSFQQVLNLYRFDKKLRMLLLNEIEKVEIAIRRAIMNIPVQMTGDIYKRGATPSLMTLVAPFLVSMLDCVGYVPVAQKSPCVITNPYLIRS